MMFHVIFINYIGLQVIAFQTMRYKVILDTIVFGGAVIGALLLASRTEWSGYGYPFFFVSSICGVTLLLKSDVSKSILWKEIFFTGVNIFGIIRWIF